MSSTTDETTVTALRIGPVARAAGMNAQALRARIQRGKIPGCFKEQRFNVPNARWYIPHDLAISIVLGEGGDPDRLDSHLEHVVQLPETIV